ncbi:DMT family transporter [Thalassomonas actiniarum]|uniref:DMT family transporter n=1 Tax=Thalassomonas actiniarum TaxID=485447 RepID=UPI001F45C8A4|nr:DMT family transporter [Thalassomonas actiniarum]
MPVLEVVMTNLTSHGLAILMTLFIAGSFLSAAELSGIIHPVALTLLRFIGAVIAFSPVILTIPKHRSAIKKVLPKSLIISLFYSVFFLCMFKSLETTTALNTTALYTLVPFITAVLCFVFFRETISGYMLNAYTMGTVGAMWVIFKGDINTIFALSLNNGDLYFLMGCFSMAGFSIAMKTLYQGESMPAMVFCTLIGGAIWMALVLIFIGQPLEIDKIRETDYFHILYLALFATLFSTLIMQKITVQLGPTKVMAYVFMTPALVILLQFVLQGQSINSPIYPGIILSVIATFYLQKVSTNKVKST